MWSEPKRNGSQHELDSVDSNAKRRHLDGKNRVDGSEIIQKLKKTVGGAGKT